MSLIGIDVGNTNCKIAIREGSSMRLVSERMPENMVRGDDVISPETMVKFLKDVRKTQHVRESKCALVLTSSQVYFRHVTLPPMSVSELSLNLPYEFRDFIQDDPDDYIYDYAVDEIVRNEDGEIERMELYAAAVRKALVESYSTTLRKAGFKLKLVIPTPMAYTRLLRSHFESSENELPEDQDIVLVDIGHANVIITLFRNLQYDSTRTIDFGCDEFDSIIASLRGIDPYTAGSYKITNFEGVLDEPDCLALCDRFAVEVSKVVNFYNFSNPEREVGRLFLLGGGANIPQIVRAITDAVAIPADNITELLPPEAHGLENATSCALAIGGMLEGEAI